MAALRRSSFSQIILALLIGVAAASCSSGDGSGPTGNSNIASITVTAPATTLERTLTTQAAAVARDAAAAVINNPSLSWSSSNNSVATVSNAGLITATGRGTARITAASGNISGFVDVQVFIEYSSIATGDQWSCDVGSIGLVHCWGANNRGQFGTGNTTNSTTPVTASGTVRLVSVSASAVTLCGLTAGGAAYCTGGNASGQLGVGASGDRNVLTAVAGGHVFTQITVGEDHACGRTAAGAAYCWGENFDGQLGNGTTTNSNQPTLVLGALPWARLHAGEQTTCGVTTDNRGFCWGQDANGQIGDGGAITNNTVDKKLQPTQVTGGSIWSSIVPGGTTTCGITTTGEVRCWGSSGTGMYGNGSIVDVSSPGAAVSGGLTFRSIDLSSSRFVCGLTTTNEAYCWGGNLDGQYGTAAPIDLSTTPLRAAGTLTFSELSVPTLGTHVCGIVVNQGTVYCWGYNGSGQMGNGTTSLLRNPTPGVVTGQVQ